jgi:hypothetical protein
MIIVIRTHLEDNLLNQQLESYAEYRLVTPFRLVSGIW